MSRYPEVLPYFASRVTIRLFCLSRPTRASKATTMTVIPRIQRRTSMTSRTPPTLFHIPKITPHVLSQLVTHRGLKNTNQIIHPLATILTASRTSRHLHQITPKHAPHPLLTLRTRTPHHRHHRHNFSFNRSSSSTPTLLLPPVQHPTVFPTSTSLPRLL
jgi:hypothetical protein